MTELTLDLRATLHVAKTLLSVDPRTSVVISANKFEIGHKNARTRQARARSMVHPSSLKCYPLSPVATRPLAIYHGSFHGIEADLGLFSGSSSSSSSSRRNGDSGSCEAHPMAAAEKNICSVVCMDNRMRNLHDGMTLSRNEYATPTIRRSVSWKKNISPDKQICLHEVSCKFSVPISHPLWFFLEAEGPAISGKNNYSPKRRLAKSSVLSLQHSVTPRRSK